MTSNITIFKNIRETETPFYRGVDKILERVKDGSSKELVKKTAKSRHSRVPDTAPDC